jgi:hypothetical protein
MMGSLKCPGLDRWPASCNLGVPSERRRVIRKRGPGLGMTGCVMELCLHDQAIVRTVKRRMGGIVDRCFRVGGVVKIRLADGTGMVKRRRGERWSRRGSGE